MTELNTKLSPCVLFTSYSITTLFYASLVELTLFLFHTLGGKCLQIDREFACFDLPPPMEDVCVKSTPGLPSWIHIGYLPHIVYLTHISTLRNLYTRHIFDAYCLHDAYLFTDCGVRPLRGQGKIVGGEKSAFGDWPWQVGVKQSFFLL